MAGAAAYGYAIAKRKQREELELTPYTPRDLAENWEFKILRSGTGAFGDPVKLRRILDEEGRAGWVLLEKFDNQRIRLKRPAAARSGDAAVDFNPYRTGLASLSCNLQFC